MILRSYPQITKKDFKIFNSMPRGGRQPGAGRPKGAVAKSTLEALESKKLLVEMFHKNAKPIFNVLIEKAMEGDMQAVRELLDRVYGKAQQSMDVTSGGERMGVEITEDQRIKLAREILNGK